MRATTAQPVRSSSAAGLPQPSVVELADEAVTEGPSGSRARVRLTWGLGADAEESGKRTTVAQGLGSGLRRLAQMISAMGLAGLC